MENKKPVQLDPAQEFVYVRTYARWLPELGRRETHWDETMDRYFNFMWDRYGHLIPTPTRKKVESHCRQMKVMPSMRAAWAAGKALERQNATGYNCSYLPFQDLRCLSEALYLLMCGTGVGFSVEKEYIDQMPVVQKSTGNGRGVFVIQDNKEGWADSFLAGLEAWFAGDDIEFD